MKGTLAWASLIAAVVVAAFSPSVQIPFFMDDYLHLSLIEEHLGDLRSISYNTFSTASIPAETLRQNMPWWTDPSFRFHYFRPIASLSLVLDFMLWGKDPRGYHYTSLAAHCLCALLIYLLALRLGLSRRFAALGALVSGLHCNHIFSVSWVCNRDSSLGSLFFLASLLSYVRYLDLREVRSKGQWGFLALCFVLFLLGVLSKESVVVEPAVLLMLLAVRTGRFGRGEAAGGRPPSMAPAIVCLAPFVVFSIGYSVWYAATGHGVSTGYLLVSGQNSLAANLAIAAKNLFLYLIALFFYVPPEFNRAALAWPWWLVWVCVLALPAGVVFWQRAAFRRTPCVWVFGVWVFVFLATPVAFIPLGRLLTTSTLGYGLVVAAVAENLLATTRRRLWRVGASVLAVLYFVLAPFALDVSSTSFLASRGDTVHLRLERAIAKVREELPRNAEIFLLNVPEPASAYMAAVVHRFHSGDKETRISVLGNAPAPPAVERDGPASLRLGNDNGIIDLNVAIPLVPLAQGARIEMPTFTVEVERMRGKQPVEVLFRLEKPLESPELAFIVFSEGQAKRTAFPARH